MESIQALFVDASCDQEELHDEVDNQGSQGADLDAFVDDNRLELLEHHDQVEAHVQGIQDNHRAERSCAHQMLLDAAEAGRQMDMMSEDGDRKEHLQNLADLVAGRLGVDSLPFYLLDNRQTRNISTSVLRRQMVMEVRQHNFVTRRVD